MDFARKHLPDKFFLEGTERKNLRNIITREMIGNTLIHREFTSAYIAKFVIEKNRMYTENASRSAGDGVITPENMEPNPKNPIIASFFRNIGWSDRLGSGVRNLFKYSKYYSGKEPEFIEGDVFRIIVPLDEKYSADAQIGKNKKSAIKNSDKKSAIKISDKKSTITEERLQIILKCMQKNIEYNTEEIADMVGLKTARTRELLKMLVNDDKIEAVGANRNRKYLKKFL
jgi:ATP-dependent DNA helicase RecG